MLLEAAIMLEKTIVFKEKISIVHLYKHGGSREEREWEMKIIDNSQYLVFFLFPSRYKSVSYYYFGYTFSLHRHVLWFIF